MNKVRLILILSALLLLFCGCEKRSPLEMKEQHPEVSKTEAKPEIPDPDAVDPNAQLLCITQSREEAEEIAALYGITLVEYEEGVALFYTEEAPQDVVRKGLDNGWPELSLNRYKKLS